jgi:hypothetical protein
LDLKDDVFAKKLDSAKPTKMPPFWSQGLLRADLDNIQFAASCTWHKHWYVTWRNSLNRAKTSITIVWELVKLLSSSNPAIALKNRNTYNSQNVSAIARSCRLG